LTAKRRREIKRRLKKIDLDAFDSRHPSGHWRNGGRDDGGRHTIDAHAFSVRLGFFTKDEFRLSRIVTQPSLAFAVFLQTETYFATPVGRDGQGAVRPCSTAANDTLNSLVARHGRLATTLCCFDAIDRAALLADIDHRAVFALRTVPAAEGREDGILVCFSGIFRG
jgi:hypothetical protein